MAQHLVEALVALAGLTAALQVDVQERPVSKVITLLQDMQAQLEDEAKNDQTLYDKLVCWCETNEKLKTEAVETANQEVAELTAAIEEYTSKDTQLTTDIAALEQAVAKSTKALDEATGIRAKESAEFSEDERDSVASIGSLSGAVTSLGKAHGGASMVQRQALVQVTELLRRKVRSQPDLVVGAVAPHQRSLLMGVLSSPDGMLSLLKHPVSLLQQPVAASSYSSQSGEIFGMLKQMKETFEANLESSRTGETTSSKAFAELKAAKLSEIQAMKDQAFNKNQDLGKAKEDNAAAKQGRENMQRALDADTAFLGDLKNKCTVTDSDWGERSKMRQDEISAISQTVAILDDDDAKDQFSKSLGLVQLRAESGKTAADHARTVEFLAAAGKRLGSQRISYLAVRMLSDPFGKLREGIDDMASNLGKEKEDEVVYKDGCVDDLHVNDKETTAKKAVKSDLETEINTLNAEEAALLEEEKRIKAQIFDAQVQMRKASEDREEENRLFQEIVSDQRATQAILEKATERLGEFYNKLALAQGKRQVPGAAVEPMPAGFKPYKKAGGGGAMFLIKNIIADSKDTEKDAIRAEQDAEAAYEAFIQDTNAVVTSLQKSVTEDQEVRAKDEIRETQDEGDKRSTVQDILTLGESKEALHTGCDFTLNNFEERQSKRDGEIEALKQSKAIFSGASFGQ